MKSKKVKKNKSERRKEDVIGTVLVSIIPLFVIIYMIVAYFIDYMSLFGFIGAFVIGFSIFTFVCGLMKNTFGKLFTRSFSLLVFMIGVTIISTDYLVFRTEYYQKFREIYGTLYLLNFLSPFLAFVIYCSMIRTSIKAFFRSRGLSKSSIRKLQQGHLNFWWYRDLNRQIPLGIIYPMNITFSLLFLLTAFLQLSIGWWDKMVSAVAVVNATTTVLCGVLSVFVGYQTHFAILSTKEKQSIISGAPGFIAVCLLEIWIGVKVLLLIL